MGVEGAAAASRSRFLAMADLMLTKNRVGGVRHCHCDVLMSLVKFRGKIRERQPMHPAGGCMLPGLHSMTFLVEAVGVAYVSVV